MHHGVERRFSSSMVTTSCSSKDLRASQGVVAGLRNIFKLFAFALQTLGKGYNNMARMMAISVLACCHKGKTNICSETESLGSADWYLLQPIDCITICSAASFSQLFCSERNLLRIIPMRFWTGYKTTRLLLTIVPNSDVMAIEPENNPDEVWWWKNMKDPLSFASIICF